MALPACLFFALCMGSTLAGVINLLRLLLLTDTHLTQHKRVKELGSGARVTTSLLQHVIPALFCCLTLFRSLQMSTL
jgi:hypothetical protein